MMPILPESSFWEVETMADLLIRGMGRPKSCAECFARDNGWCNILGCSIGNSAALRMIDRRDDCPLVGIPDHGRCIDADAFAAKYVAALPDGLAALKDPKNIPAMTAVIQALLLDIAEADTIIPASKEGEA